MGGKLSIKNNNINRYHNNTDLVSRNIGYDSINRINNIRSKPYVNHTQLPNNLNIERKIPKYKSGNPVHVVYSNNTYNAVTITGISHRNTNTIFYNFEYNFGLSEGTAAEENLHLRNINDRTRNDHLSNLQYHSDRDEGEDEPLSDRINYETKSINLNYNSLETTNSKEIVCSICLNNNNNNNDNDNDNDNDNLKYKLPNCSHFYHKDCIDKWIKTDHNSCPTCRAVIN